MWVDCGDGVATQVRDGTPLYDSELRSCCESYGLHVFAWRPVRCRNGLLRWLTTVERHHDGTYTKGRLK